MNRGFYVETFGGGQWTSIAWFANECEAKRYNESIWWNGMHRVTKA